MSKIELSEEQKNIIKDISHKICRGISKQEEFIVDRGFDKLYSVSKTPRVATNEGGWIPHDQVATYALLVVIFLRDTFVQAIADEAAKTIIERLKRWIRGLLTNPDEIKKLKEDLIALAEKSDASDEEKKRLIDGINRAIK